MKHYRLKKYFERAPPQAGIFSFFFFFSFFYSNYLHISKIPIHAWHISECSSVCGQCWVETVLVSWCTDDPEHVHHRRKEARAGWPESSMMILVLLRPCVVEVTCFAGSFVPVIPVFMTLSRVFLSCDVQLPYQHVMHSGRMDVSGHLDLFRCQMRGLQAVTADFLIKFMFKRKKSLGEEQYWSLFLSQSEVLYWICAVVSLQYFYISIFILSSAYLVAPSDISETRQQSSQQDRFHSNTSPLTSKCPSSAGS